MHVTPAERRWRPWIEAHQKTRLTVRAFCDEHDLTYSTLCELKRWCDG